jgi:hypothetical protein
VEFSKTFLLDWFKKNNPEIRKIKKIEEKIQDNGNIVSNTIEIKECGVNYSVVLSYERDYDLSDGGTNWEEMDEHWYLKNTDVKHRMFKPAHVSDWMDGSALMFKFYLNDIEYKFEQDFLSACKNEIIKKRYNKK